MAEDVEEDFVAVEPSRLDWVDEEVRGVEAKLLVPLVCRGVAGGIRVTVRRWRWRLVTKQKRESRWRREGKGEED